MSKVDPRTVRVKAIFAHSIASWKLRQQLQLRERKQSYSDPSVKPNKHDKCTQCCINGGPASQTVDQHLYSQHWVKSGPCCEVKELVKKKAHRFTAAVHDSLSLHVHGRSRRILQCRKNHKINVTHQVLCFLRNNKQQRCTAI